MMKGKPQTGVSGPVSTSSLAYPGNSFKYCSELRSDEPQQKPKMLKAINTFLQSKAANTTSCKKSTNGSVFSNAGSFPRQRKLSSQKTDSLSEDDMLESDGQIQDEPQTEKVNLEISQTAETNIQDTELSCTVHCKTVKNGPQKYKN